jgi:Tat protein secretion system quality control protein TatD with DNase activity
LDTTTATGRGKTGTAEDGTRASDAGEKDHGLNRRPILTPQQAYRRLVSRATTANNRGEKQSSSSSSPPWVLVVDTHCHAHLLSASASAAAAATTVSPYHIVEKREQAEEEGEENGPPMKDESRGGDLGDCCDDRMSDRSSDNDGDDDDTNAVRRTAAAPLPDAAVTAVSLVCAVSPSDWQACLDYASMRAPTVVPALGVHPWYLDRILRKEDDGDGTEEEDGHTPAASAAREEEGDNVDCRGGDRRSGRALESHKRRRMGREWLRKLKSMLEQHPGCLVGEIGLCKQARFLRTYEGGKAEALRLQRLAFQEQLRLACELGRPASVHCVNQHGVLLQVLQSLADDLLRRPAVRSRRNDPKTKPPRGDRSNGTYAVHGDDEDDHKGDDDIWPSRASRLPPAIALHSFTGTAHQVKQLLAWEASLPLQLRWIGGDAANDDGTDSSRDRASEEHGDNKSTSSTSSNTIKVDQSRNPQADPPPRPTSLSLPPLLYFGFSHAVNVAMCSSEKSQSQGRDAVRAIPQDRLLAESDVSHPHEVLGGTAGAIAYLEWALGNDDDGNHRGVDGGDKDRRQPRKANDERVGGEHSSPNDPALEAPRDASSSSLLRIANLTAGNGIRFLQHHKQQHNL